MTKNIDIVSTLLIIANAIVFVSDYVEGNLISAILHVAIINMLYLGILTRKND